ncbi:MAG: DUF4412 domain-containing protein [Deltaproteobacteria bacterium]|nr:DUF4412 domain-containing protein [Deltaproteobacteria bacterium]
MKKVGLMLKFLLFSVILGLMISSAAVADLYWESDQETKGMPGRPDETKVIKTYLTSYASRTEREGQITIMNFDTKIMYHINPQAKTYQQINMAEMGKPPEIKDEKGQMQQQMMKNMMGNIQVTPTQETRQIAGYNCQKYLVSGMMMNSDYWLSKDVKGYEELKEIGKKVTTIFDENPMMKQMNIAGMMGQLDGFPVQMVMNIMKGTSTTTLKKIEKKSLDKSLFSVPEGYTQTQSKMPMMFNQNGK